MKLHSSATNADAYKDKFKGIGEEVSQDVVAIAQGQKDKATVVHLTETDSEMWNPEIVSYQQPQGTPYHQDTTVVLRPRTARHNITFRDTSFRLSKRLGKKHKHFDSRRDAPTRQDFDQVSGLVLFMVRGIGR